MASAEQVKEKIEELIELANHTSGKSDSTLYQAILTLVSGYGGVSGLGASTGTYGGLYAEGMSAGDFVEIVPSFGSGTLTTETATAVKIIPLTDSKVMVVYSTSLNVYAQLITGGGESWIISDPFEVALTLPEFSFAAVALGQNKVLVVTQNRSYSGASDLEYGNGLAYVLTVNGDQITKKINRISLGTTMYDLALVALSENKVLAVYRYGTDYGNGHARVLTVTETTIKTGAYYPFDLSSRKPQAVALTDSKVLVAYETFDGSEGRAVVLSCSDTTVTKGSGYTFRTGASSDLALTALDKRRALLVYRDAATTGYLTATVLQVTGTSVTTVNSPSLTFTKYGGTKPAVVRVNDDVVLMTANVLTQSEGYAPQALLLTVSESGISKGTELQLPNGKKAQDTLHALAVTSEGNAVAVYTKLDMSGATGLAWQGFSATETALNYQLERGAHVVPLTSEKYPVGVVKSILENPGGGTPIVFAYKAGTPADTE